MSENISVCFDVNYAGGVFAGARKITGIGRVILDLAEAILLYEAEDVEVMFSSMWYPQFYRFIEEYFKECGLNADFLKNSKPQQYIYDRVVRLRLPMWKGKNIGRILSVLNNKRPRADIVHSPFYPFDREFSGKAEKRIVMVHDILAITNKEYFSAKRGEKDRNLLAKVAKYSNYFTTPSVYTKKSFCDEFKINEDRVKVTPLAASKKLFYTCKNSDFQSYIREKYGINDRAYILSISTIELRKNTIGLLRAFRKLVYETKNKELCLVLTGINTDGARVLQEYIINNRLQGSVIFTGHVQDSELASLYSGAEVFVYPSFCEGFGLPPLEAMQCGVPVVCSNTTSLPEVVGDAGILIDPNSDDDLCGALFDILKDKELREELISKGLQRAEGFTWKNTAEETIEFYRYIASS